MNTLFRFAAIFCGCLTIAVCPGTVDITLAANGTDSPRPAWSSSKLHGTPVPPEQYRISPAFPKLKFDHPTGLQEIPGTGRLLVTQMNGQLFTMAKDPTVTTADAAGDLAKLAGGDVSLFSAIVHPDFAQNRFLYACLVHPGDGRHTRVVRYTMSRTDKPVIDPASETVIITWPSGGHNAGCLQFGKDGMLYIATGDGSGPNPPDGLTTGQDVSDLLGAILRIDVSQTSNGRNYQIPSDNPFVSLAGARPEIFAYGLRNPWKFGIDPSTGDVLVADNGWETWESIFLARSGTNCGWPIMEGRARLRAEVAPGPTPIVPPLRDHHHSEANSVIGGPVYRGSTLPDLNGFFVYGDYITGTIWAVKPEADGSGTGLTLADTDLRIIAFTEGSAGELFVLDYDLTGQIYQLLPNQVEDLSASFPRQLSKTGLFSGMRPLQPVSGVEPYDVIVPRWMDGALAKRWVAIPGTASISVVSEMKSSAEYPEGTVFVKHLSVPTSAGSPERPLETQILHYENGVWNPYSYLWNADGSDAELVSSVGTNTTVQWPDADAPGGFTDRTWRTGAVNECRLCHNAGPGFVLGFVPHQLARSVPAESNTGDTGVGGKTDQLSSLVSRKVVTGDFHKGGNHPLRLVDPGNTSLNLNDRARSYLHANCSMCHHRGGNAIVSFFLTRDLPFDQMNTNKGTGIGTFGMQNAKIIVPGDPFRSVLMYRMSKLGYARMPYIGSQVVDSAGVALVAEWIQSLPKQSAAELSSPLTPRSEHFTAMSQLRTANGTPADRDAAVQKLVTTTEGALSLIVGLHSDTLTKADLESAIRATRASKSDIQGLFDAFVPESQRRKTLGRSFLPPEVLSLTGDVARGRTIFFSDNSRCRACHHVNETAQSVGPTLTEIHKKYPHDSELLQHVMNPSMKVDDKFAAWIAVTLDGRMVNGLMERESGELVVLRTAERQLVELRRSELDELQKSPKSLMPDAVLSDLTAQEAADLLAFIRSH